MSANTCWNIVNFRSGLVARLIEEGYRVAVLAPPDGHAGRLAEMGCRFVPLAIDSKGASPLRDTNLIGRYLRALREISPLAYLGFTIKPNVYGSLAAQMLAIPVVNNVSGLGTAFIRRSWITPIATLLYTTAFSRSQTVFFQNDDDRALFAGLRIVDGDRSAVLPGSGVDLGRFAPSGRAPRPAGARHFLLVARLLWDKGVGEYVEAARRVRARFPAARFALLGFLDVENRTAVSRTDVDGWVREGVVDYLGATDDVRPFLREADCIVLPSYREGTARTLLEGAAMAKPLIATDAPGCRNVVEHGRNGYLVQPRDAADLARRMEDFLSLPADVADAMGRSSRAKVAAEFDERLVIDRYLDVLAALRARRSQS